MVVAVSGFRSIAHRAVLTGLVLRPSRAPPRCSAQYLESVPNTRIRIKNARLWIGDNPGVAEVAIDGDVYSSDPTIGVKSRTEIG
jgi:hypothetical protein